MLKKIWLMAVVVLAGTAVFATDYTWNGSSGSFQTDSNWSPVGVPGAADLAKFTTAGTYGVSFAGDATNTATTVGADVTFALNGYAWLLSGSLSFSGTSIARFGGGNVDFGGNVTAGTNQKLVLNSGAARFRGAQLGTSSGGTIEVNGGEHVLDWALPLSAAPSGGVSFRMTGGRLTMTKDDNFARCSLWNGSRMSLEGGTLSIRYQVDINGVPSAPAVMDIYTNASLLQCPGIGFNVSRTAGGLGIVNILGGTYIQSNCNVNVVNVNSTPLTTTGIVNLVAGKFHVHLGNMRVGSTSNGVAIVRQTGGQMQVTGETAIGKERNTLGFLKQEGGDAWYSQLYVGAFDRGTGEVTLSGGRLAIAGNGSAIGKVAGSTGRFLQTGGELLISNSLSVGNSVGAVGSYTNTGGSLWLNGALYLGSSGNNLTGALGRAYFSGPTNYISGGITIGNSGADTGELTVTGGSLVVPNGSAADLAGLVVGRVAGSTGAATLSGGNSFFKGITVGDSGTGSLAITGGMLTMTNSWGLMVGNNAGSLGTLEISGGTNIFCGSSTTIGQKGIGFARFSGGYTYTTNRFVVGGGSNGIGRLELCGGILSTPIIDGRDTTLTNGNPGGYSEVLFDGGTLQHSVDAEWWMPGGFVSTFGKATLTDRGAVIDSNGGTVTVSQALSNEVGHAGSFTKKGAGQVMLYSGYNAFTGRIAVEAGELIVPVTGAIYLTGGVAIDAGAILNLTAAGAVRDTLTASGTVSRIDGALSLKSGVVLTNGVGAVLGGSGVVTGSVVFASGSAYGRDKADPSGALLVTGSILFEAGASVRLAGYTEQDLKAGVPLLTAGTSGTLAVSGALPVTLNGASHVYWQAKVSPDGKTLLARYIPNGSMISVR